jgi:hypothetical protein
MDGLVSYARQAFSLRERVSGLKRKETSCGWIGSTRSVPPSPATPFPREKPCLQAAQRSPLSGWR